MRTLILFLTALPVMFFSAGAVKDDVPEFSGESAFAYLEKQVAFGPRNPGSEGHAACRDYLAAELRKYTDQVRIQRFSHLDRHLDKRIPMFNIFARFPGTDPGSGNILLAAHWDTRPFADQDPDEENRDIPIPGANDGASGVAVLLEIARMLSEDRPQVSVDILLTDGEDYGREGETQNYLLGARHFAKNLPRYPYRYGLLLDLIGDADLHIPKERYSDTMLPQIVDAVWKRARELGLPAFENRAGPDVIDDHRPLIEAGVPIIVIIDFDYKYWHTLEDTPDKCSRESLEQVGVLVTDTIYNGLF